MKRTKITLSMDPGTIDLLKKAGGESGASRYVEGLVTDAAGEWRAAVIYLKDSGWSKNEVLAACDSLNGVWLLGHQPGAALAANLADSTELNALDEKWSLKPKAWKAKIEAVNRRPGLAHALLTVVREFWRYNEELSATLERLVGGKRKGR